MSRAAGEEDSVYRGYYDYREPVDRIPGHRVLALNGGSGEKFLKVRAELDDALALREIRQRVVRPVSVSNRFVAQAAEEAWKRLIQPSLEREVRGELTQQAAEQAIRTFGDNLRPLLMQPPVRGKVTLGFDPAYRTGCKLAVVDPIGRVLETGVIYPTPPHNKTREARQVLADMIQRPRRSGHCHWQRHRIPGIGAVCVGASGGSAGDRLYHGQRGGGIGLFRIPSGSGGISGL